VSIPSRFNGPRESGNGGYCSGVFAALLDGLAEVDLRRPIPLETPLEAERANGSLRVSDGEALIAEARTVTQLELEVPDPVSVEDARLASGSYPGEKHGLFCRCFVCGRAREDSMKVFAGPVEGRDMVATPWIPPEWSADADGRVRPEFVWAALDCPTYFAQYGRGELAMSFLARLAARIDAPVPAGEEHVVIAWPLEVDGRKRHAGSAVLSADGETLALARALMVEPRQG